MLRSLAVPVMVFAVGSAHAQDWPCDERYDSDLSPEELWGRPLPDEARATWRDDPVIRDVTAELAVRRTPLPEAESRIAEFAASLDPETREERLSALFAGLVETIERERKSIIGGIMRFTERQEQLGARIQTINAELRQLAGAATADAELRRQALSEERAWDLRIFDERQGSLGYLCEQPLLLEERAEALGRALARELE